MQNMLTPFQHPQKFQPITTSTLNLKCNLNIITQSPNLIINQMKKTLGMIHCGAKFLSTCGHGRLENKLSVTKIQWWKKLQFWDRTDIKIPKGETGKNKRFIHPKQV